MDTQKQEYQTLPEKHLKGIARTVFDSPKPTESQLARRAKSIATLKEMGLPYLEHLPVVEEETTLKFRTAEVVAKRCLATILCAAKGETNDQALVDELVKEYAASNFFSPAEQRFIDNLEPPQQELIDYRWRYECVHVFLWALNARENLVAPNEICPVSDDAKIVRKAGRANFVGEAKLRPASEILDMADLYYHLHWAVIELRIKGKKSDLVDEEIIRERHRALNWLIRYLNQEWDDVTTDT